MTTFILNTYDNLSLYGTLLLDYTYEKKLS